MRFEGQAHLTWDEAKELATDRASRMGQRVAKCIYLDAE